MNMKTSIVTALMLGTAINTPAYALDIQPVLGDDSVISFMEGTESDYSFVINELGANNTLTPKYYKIVLKNDLNMSEAFKWTQLDSAPEGGNDNVVAVKLPHDQTVYLKYEFTAEDGDFADRDGQGDNQWGAAINNHGDRGVIEANFVNNKVVAQGSGRVGGAINNSDNATISGITGDFVNNRIEDNSNDVGLVFGGAIHNSSGAKIGDIKGDFVGNHIQARGESSGGAIANRSGATIGSIEGNFVGNDVEILWNYASGGAIFNESGATIEGDIKGDFVGNTVVSQSLYGNDSNNKASGGAILNNGTIAGNVTGDFIANSAQGARAYGGAINMFKGGEMKDITGNFIGNSVVATSTYGGGEADGGAIDNNGKIGKITGNFIDNKAVSLGTQKTDYAYGGAIYNEEGTIDSIEGDFENNSAEGYTARGGAIYNHNGTIGNIKGDFESNSVSGGNDAQGGAIYNSYSSSIESIEGNFKNNSIVSIKPVADFYSFTGGAIYNGGNINSIRGDFENNFVRVVPLCTTSYCYEISGGAIYNNGGLIGNIEGDFKNNSVSGYIVLGGAVGNDHGGRINSIKGDFIGNSATGKTSARGGGLFAMSGAAFDNIEGNFKSNFVKAGTYAQGGAIYSITGGVEAISNITGDFVGNYAQGVLGAEASGGAIYYGAQSIGSITGDFKNNYAITDFDGKARGGAIYYYGGSINNITGSFVNNYVSSANGVAQGGAVYAARDMNFVSGDKAQQFTGNYMQSNGVKTYNAIYVGAVSSYTGDVELSFDTTGGGSFVINDSIDGDKHYDLAFNGDDTINDDLRTEQFVALNNEVNNARNVSVSGTTLRLDGYKHADESATNWDGKGLFNGSVNMTLNNAVFDTANNGHLDVINLSGLYSDNSVWHLDVDPDEMKSDMLNVNGDVNGQTKLIVHASSDTDFSDKGQILFAQSINDTVGNADSFVVSRVYKSPYLYGVKYADGSDVSVAGGDVLTEPSKQWYFEMLTTENPDKDIVDDFDYGYEKEEKPADGGDDDNSGDDDNKPGDDDKPGDDNKPSKGVYAPEIGAYAGLQQAAIEQNRSIANSVANGLAFAKSATCYEESCNVAELVPHKKVWIDTMYESSEFEELVDMDAEVKGVTIGADLLNDGQNRGGVFGSYRSGKYELSGEGRYFSTIGSKITSDSYLAGAYYKYNRDNVGFLGTVFAGKQDMDVKTDDAVAFADTSAMQYGFSAELAKKYAMTENFALEPVAGLYYTLLDIDGFNDNVGRSVSYDTLHYLEAELGLKLEYLFCDDGNTNRVYAKPSVIRTFASGGKARIEGLDGEVKSYKDRTLARMEFGGDFGLTKSWAGYARAGYTFGDDYKAYDFNLGLEYAF